MKPHWLSALIGGLVLGASVRATEEHILTVFQPLISAPEIDIVAVPFVTSFGAIEESTLHAMTWPCRLSSRDEEQEETRTEDLNLVSLLGIGVTLERVEDEFTLIVDLTKMRPIPDSVREEKLGAEVTRKDALDQALRAAEKNLAMVGVFDCPLRLMGREAHEDLKDWKPATALNPVEKVWGKWTYEQLPRKRDDGDLAGLASQAIASPTSAGAALATLFLIAAEEEGSAKQKEEMGDFMARLLTRAGDRAFAGALAAAEPDVQAKILAALKARWASAKGLPEPSQFPETFAIKPKQGQAGSAEG